MKRGRSLAFPAACVSWLATSVGLANGPSTDDELRAALRVVLEHGDLADLKFLSDTLGLDLRVMNPDPHAQYIDPKNDFRAIGIHVPPALFATSLAYFAEYTPQYQRSRMSLDFRPRQCPRLADWSKAWKVPLERWFDPHGAADGELIKWPGDHGIELSALHTSDGTCSVKLLQLTNQPVHLTAPAVASLPSSTLAERVATVLSIGDLRDYTRVAGALHTELIAPPNSTQAGLLNKGSLDFAEVIAGVDPWRSAYYGDDTGWISPPSFSWRPRRLAPRETHLDLYFDYETTCLSLADLDSSVRRAVPRAIAEGTGTKGVVYTVNGDNEIKLGASSEDGCIREVRFDQTTAIASNVKMPLMFPMPDSLNARANTLAAPAQKSIDAIMARVNAPSPTPLSEIEVITCQAPGTPTPEETAAAARLATYVEDAFSKRGVPAEKIKRVSGPESRELECAGRVIGERDGSGPAFVVVTVSIDGK